MIFSHAIIITHIENTVPVHRQREEHSRQQKIGKMNVYSIFTQGALLPLILVMSENTGPFGFTTLRRDPQERVGTHYPLHSSRSNRNTEVVTKRLRVDAHFKGNITSTQCFESSRIEKR